MKYVEIVTNLPIDRTFQYKVPDSLKNVPEIGKRVLVPFRNFKKIGYIVSLETLPVVKDPKSIIDIIDEEPVFSKEMIKLSKWIKDTYFCSWGEVLDAMLPGGIKKGKVTMTPRIKEVENIVEKEKPHLANPEQAFVLDKMLKCIDKEVHNVFLLYGITGSGKTEIYLQAMEHVLAKGKGGVILVPEISLTPQTVERFIARFGDRVAVFHSRMLESVKFNEWKRIASGEAKIVVGPRSAVFSPLVNPGIFIIDEEHEPSYKQEDVPRYHARDVAIERAKLLGVPVILGSATPSLESYYKAVNGEYTLVELTERVLEKELPKVKLVDMRMDFDTRVGKRIISPVLSEILKKDIGKKQQALIFLNRRGFSTFALCQKCGFVLKCQKCDSPMVFHKEKELLICHYCNRRKGLVTICPSCKGDYLVYKGTGTERVEKEVNKIIPDAKVCRMDSDTMKKRGAHETILNDFKNHKIDVIVGTQMIAKGFDFPKVTLVGVISADANLNLPDFRAGERTFNLITQVAGRAGRGDLGGEVIVQTFSPEHYAVKFAAKHDYNSFYLKEIESRRELGFPPFKSLIQITLRSRNEELVIKNIEKLASHILNKVPEFDILGPAPAPIEKVRGHYRWNLLLKGDKREELVSTLKNAIKGYRKSAGVIMAIDVDPN